MADKIERAGSPNPAPHTSETAIDHTVPLSAADTPVDPPPEIRRLLAEIRCKEMKWFAENPGQIMERPYCPGETWPLAPEYPGPAYLLKMRVWKIGPGMHARELVVVVDANSPTLQRIQ